MYFYLDFIKPFKEYTGLWIVRHRLLNEIITYNLSFRMKYLNFFYTWTEEVVNRLFCTSKDSQNFINDSNFAL